ncbi:S-adenosyl-L-methionine-dependent methyltransferase [Aulographum hederae CBS 113979]|uniref:S-adenosyl-L-methionine-dependent methyltransferase n=1 Tax=Aulographum hederae CBS 113979 TaxID=1176131 RepID=A0A6G1HFM3_9PEZI|nr:S-adenosyl-L-methionine-dependent methyltransferase [Aulographum hederae CBS 113979]
MRDSLASDATRLTCHSFSTTTSLASSIYDYRRENGRTYHAYKDGNYFLPNDEVSEQYLQHHLFTICFENSLYFAPIRDPQTCLDIGTGTGIWAIDFAQDHPQCAITGIDLSPIQPSFVPPNLTFVIDDAEEEWIYSHKFDYIHARLMAGSLSDWEKLIQAAFDHLEPGGWFEIQDYILPCKSNDGSYEGTHLQAWGNYMLEAARKFGRPMDLAQNYAGWMKQAGFVDVVERMFIWPTNPWPKEVHLKEVGKWNEVNITNGMHAFTMAPFTRYLGWSEMEVEVFCAKVRADVRDRSIHAYFQIPVVYGRKPPLPDDF